LHQVYEGLVGSERLHGFINRFQAIEHQAEPKQNDPELFQRIRLTQIAVLARKHQEWDVLFDFEGDNLGTYCCTNMAQNYT